MDKKREAGNSQKQVTRHLYCYKSLDGMVGSICLLIDDAD